MELQEAFDQFVETFWPYTISDTIAGRTTCSEEAVLEDLFVAGGREDLVPSLRTMHAEGDDDCDDLHHDEYLQLTGKSCDCQGEDDKPIAPFADLDGDNGSD